MKSQRSSGKRGKTSHPRPNGGLPRRLEGVARSHARAARERGKGRRSLARSHAARKARHTDSPYKSEPARRLEISKIVPPNLNLFLVTLEESERSGDSKGKCPLKRMKSRSAREGSLTRAPNLHSTFLRVNGVIEMSTNKQSNRLKFRSIYLH